MTRDDEVFLGLRVEGENNVNLLLSLIGLGLVDALKEKKLPTEFAYIQYFVPIFLSLSDSGLFDKELFDALLAGSQLLDVYEHANADYSSTLEEMRCNLLASAEACSSRADEKPFFNARYPDWIRRERENKSRNDEPC